MTATGGTTAVFVYGTLLPGQARWPALEPHALTTGPARAKGRLWDTGAGRPAVSYEWMGRTEGLSRLPDGWTRTR